MLGDVGRLSWYWMWQETADFAEWSYLHWWHRVAYPDLVDMLATELEAPEESDIFERWWEELIAAW